MRYQTAGVIVLLLLGMVAALATGEVIAVAVLLVLVALALLKATAQRKLAAEGWFRDTPQARALLEAERAKLEVDELRSALGELRVQALQWANQPNSYRDDDIGTEISCGVALVETLARYGLARRSDLTSVDALERFDALIGHPPLEGEK